MSHAINGIVGLDDLLCQVPPLTQECRLAPLPRGWALMVWPRDSDASDVDPMVLVSQFAATLPVPCAIAIVATDYFGGHGEQSAAAWRDGEPFMRYASAKSGTINAALKGIGVEVTPGYRDEFATIGLGWYRDNDDWLEYAVHGKTSKPWDNGFLCEDTWRAAIERRRSRLLS